MPSRTHNRSLIADRGVVVANHPLAAAAGVEMFATGGNAIDAAIAACLAVSVVEPAMSSIFGAGFVLIRRAGGEIVALDNYIDSPAAAYDGIYRWESVEGGIFRVEGQLNELGHLAVGVPGSLKAYHESVARYGSLSWPEICAPAVRFARDGFAISPLLADFIKSHRTPLARYPDSADVFLVQGLPREQGTRLVRTDYADTLESIARDGSDLLYGGELARRVSEDMSDHGAILTFEDLQEYEVRRREPVRTFYREYEIVGMGPCSAGGTLLAQALNILEGFDVASLGFGTPESTHLIAEALKLAFADRYRYLGDPDQESVPVEWLISKEYADRRRVEVDLRRARTYESGVPISGEPGFEQAADSARNGPAPPAVGESANTTHVTACDREGNMVSTTQTLNGAFGSHVTVPGTGMLMNNCMMLFDPRPGGRHSVGPSKRPVSSNTPTFILRDGKPMLALGTPGATRIPAAVLQTIANVID
ncbi:MAG: gamma-glutamyltransferase, partial [Gammaproteobacteria bacterium]|nr:gamma-glutamyltransferase [Gammaproteobacteria bacterium]